MKKTYIIPTTTVLSSDMEQGILAGSNPPLSGKVEPTSQDSGLGEGGTISGGGNGDNIDPSKSNSHSVWDWDDEDFAEE